MPHDMSDETTTTTQYVLAPLQMNPLEDVQNVANIFFHGCFEGVDDLGDFILS